MSIPKTFVSLLRKSIPEEEYVVLSSLPKTLKKIDPLFSTATYGYESLLELLRSVSKYVSIRPVGDYTPPIYECKLIGVSDGKFQLGAEVEPKAPVNTEEEEFNIRIVRDLPKPTSPIRKVLSSTHDAQRPLPSERNIKDTQYVSLMRIYGNQNNSEVFGFFRYSPDEEETPYSPYEKLASMAIDEDWTRDSKYPFDFLKGYLNQTFLRLMKQGKIEYSKDRQLVCFNSGLQTRDFKKDIILVFKKTTIPGADTTDWTYIVAVDSYSSMMENFENYPELATYIDNPADLIFNPAYSLEVNTAHIADENSDRLPEELRKNPTLAAFALDGALSSLINGLRRDYRMAIPHWHHDRIQLLIPVDLLGNGNEPIVLVAERDDNRRIYRIKTILTQDMAYGNARVLRRLDGDWLK